LENKSIGSRIFKGAVVIVLVGILAKIASFFAEAILAAIFGTSSQSDAYYMVSSVQAVVYPMLSVGIWKVFLPLYKGHIARGERDLADALTNKALTFFIIVSSVVVILLVIFAPFVVTLVAPGFTGDTRTLCIKLVRISAPMYIFIISSAIYASLLQCHNRFLGSQIREVISHIPTIIAAVLFYKHFGIEAMAWALVVAGVLRLLIELPFVNWNYRYRPDVKFNSAEFKLMLKRMPAALVSAGVGRINTLVDKAMASLLPTGTVSGLNYGYKLMSVFSGLLSSAIATAMYPQMIELITLNKKDALGKLIVRIINIFCVLMIPITLACVVFRTELVAAVYQRGAFDASSTALTASVFAIYCLCLFTAASNTVLSNIFYGHGDTKTAMFISLAHLGINIVLNIVFIRLWGVNGLALATSLSSILTFVIRLIASRKYVKLSLRAMFRTGLKVLLASVISVMIPRVIFWFFPANIYLTLIVSAVDGIAVYLVMVRLLKLNELDDVLTLVKRVFKRE
jgi:murein biosynthesis integral membrane protein MurJ